MPTRRRAALALGAGVLAAHAWLLALLPSAPGPAWRAEPSPALQLRRLVSQTGPAQPSAATAPQAGWHAAAPRAPRPATTAAPSEPVPTAAATPPAQPARDSAADSGARSVPLYATRLPPPLTLRYEMNRGPVQGTAELDWRPDDSSYTLSLSSQVAGQTRLAWASQGGFDAAGVAPLRYVESRRGREQRAANFQRDAGRISFSGPTIEHPLLAGAQDRLSWMVQLAAVLQASPELAAPETQVSMWVVGTRGDAQVWTFSVQGAEAVELPGGRVDAALHLRREALHPYDTQVLVWLDPARHFLPVRVLLTLRAGGQGMELRLQELVAH